MFSIEFDEEEGKPSTYLRVTLGPHSEKMICSTVTFSKAQYKDQWVRALGLLLDDDVVVGLFTSLDIGYQTWGRLWLLTVVPASEISRSVDLPSEDFYITQRFLHVTIDPDDFVRRIPQHEGHGVIASPYDEFSFYYLDVQYPERIFPYLSAQVEGLSCWNVNREDIVKFLAVLKENTSLK